MLQRPFPGEPAMPTQPNRHQRQAKVIAVPASARNQVAFVKIAALLSLAVLLTIIAISFLLGGPAAAEVPFVFDATSALVDADTSGEVPYDRDGAVVLAEQQQALAETAGYSTPRFGSAAGASALAIAALAWAGLALRRIAPQAGTA